MFAAAVLSLVVVCHVYAIVDLNCTLNGAYTPAAVQCANVQPASVCATLYTGTAVVAGATAERPNNCWGNGTVFMQSFKDLAVAQCPLTCGYCCDTAAFTCNNIQFPRFPCNQVTNTMCNDPNWRPILVTDCPATCGFCTTGGCIDVAPNCQTDPTICITKGLETFIAANCQRTCNLCNSTSTATTSSSTTVSCVGTVSAPNCPSWVANGFCNNAGYTTASKQQFCCAECFGTSG